MNKKVKTLNEFVDEHFDGSTINFAKAQLQKDGYKCMTKQQASQMLDRGDFIVIDNKLYLFRRHLSTK